MPVFELHRADRRCHGRVVNGEARGRWKSRRQTSPAVGCGVDGTEERASSLRRSCAAGVYLRPSAEGGVRTDTKKSLARCAAQCFQ